MTICMNSSTYTTFNANDMKIFIVLCKSTLKILKIAVYRFLISFLVSELLMFKDLQKRPKKWCEKCAVWDKINQN